MKNGVSLLAGRRRQISILLTIIALLLWTHSILNARLEIGFLGLIHSLPVTFFVALAVLTVASAILWVSKQRHSRLLLLQLVMLISFLWLIPVVTGGSRPFINHAYMNLGLINYIVDEGHFSSRQLWYLAWPQAHILFTMMRMAGSINLEPLIGINPFFTTLICSLFLYVLLKNFLGEERTNYCWGGLWLFSLATWGGGGFSSPQGQGFLLLLLVLALITRPALWERGSPKLALLSTAGILMVGLLPTHLLTSLVAGLMLSVFSLAKRTKLLLPIIGLCVVLVICWDVTGGGNIIRKVTSQPVWNPAMETPASEETVEKTPIPERERPEGTFTLHPGAIARTEITQHLRGSESHIAVVKVRVLHSAIFALIGIAGAIFVLCFRRKSDTIAILAMSLAPLLLLPISGHYGEELLQRVYLFTLPFMAYFGVMLLDIRSKLPLVILCLLLIIAYPTQTISRYANQAVDYFPADRVAGLKFFDNNTTHGYVTGASPLGRTNNLLQYGHLSYVELEWREDGSATRLYTREDVPYYIAISNRDRAWYSWFWGNDRFIGKVEQMLGKAVNCGLIYSTPNFKLYESDG